VDLDHRGKGVGDLTSRWSISNALDSDHCLWTDAPNNDQAKQGTLKSWRIWGKDCGPCPTLILLAPLLMIIRFSLDRAVRIELRSFRF
jgi:hypothetical protein